MSVLSKNESTAINLAVQSLSDVAVNLYFTKIMQQQMDAATVYYSFQSPKYQEELEKMFAENMANMKAMRDSSIEETETKYGKDVTAEALAIIYMNCK